MTGPEPDRAVLRWTRRDTAVVVYGFPAAGVLLGLALRWLAGVWELPVLGVIRQIDRVPEPWATLGCAAVGGLLGLGVALVAVYETLQVTVDRQGATLARKGRSTRLERARVGYVFVDDGRLVLLSADGSELVAEPTDMPPAELGATFTRLGYPWRDGDPFAADFRRWVPNVPGLSQAAEALMVARQRALDRDDADEAATLRTELGALGVVVRDDGRRQSWRPTPPS